LGTSYKFDLFYLVEDFSNNPTHINAEKDAQILNLQTKCVLLEKELMKERNRIPLNTGLEVSRLSVIFL
jgi:hypothetical protein